MNAGGTSPVQKALDGVQIGTSCYAKPVAVVYGKNRVASNIIWMPHELWEWVEGSRGGKGGPGSGAGDQYFQAVMLAICEGPVSIGKVWRDKDVFTGLDDPALEADGQFVFFPGNRSQEPWSFLSAVWPNNGSVYTDIFYDNPHDFTLPAEAKEVLDVYRTVEDPAGFTLAQAVPYEVIDVGPPIVIRLTPESVPAYAFVVYRKDLNPGQVPLGYGGTAVAACQRLALGNSNSVKNFSFEVKGFLGDDDQNPADILADWLSNKVYGAGWDASEFEVVNGPDPDHPTESGFRRYADQMNFKLSPVFDEQRSGSEQVQWILNASNGGMFWSADGKLKVLPLGDVSVGTYAPYNTPIYDIDADLDCVVDGPDDEAITITHTALEKTFNCSPIEFLDSESAKQLPDGTWDYSNLYNVSVADDWDQADVVQSGGEVRKAQTLSLHCITKQRIAQIISKIRTQRSIYIRNTYAFRLPWRYGRLEPLDLITLTDGVLGLDRKVVRITSIEEDEDETLLVEAEEWPVGVAHSTLYSPQRGEGGGQNSSAAPSATNPPVIVVPPLSATLDGITPELWVAASGAGKDWGGAQVWLSWDGASYKYQGDLSAAVHGTLRNTVQIGPPDDQTTALRVDVRASGSTLASVGEAELPESVWLDSEILGFRTAVLQSDGAYLLSDLSRGMQGTLARSHAVGSRFLLLNDRVMRIPFDPTHAGTLAYIKLIGFNISRTRYEDMSAAQVYVYPVGASTFVVPSTMDLPVQIRFDNFDLGEWVAVIPGPGVLTTEDGAISAGKVLRCTGGRLWLVHRSIIPYEPNRLYKIDARFRQQTPGTVTRKLAIGFCGVAADGVTIVDRTGGTTYTDQHLLETALTDTEWIEAAGFWKGRGATGTGAGTLAQARTGNAVMNAAVRFVRPMICFNDFPPGDGAQEIDALEITDGNSDAAAADADAAADAAEQAATDAGNALTLAGSKITSYFYPDDPRNHTEGDPPQAIVPHIGDLWFKTGNTVYRPNRWNGSSWEGAGQTLIVGTEIAAENITAQHLDTNIIISRIVQTPTYQEDYEGGPVRQGVKIDGRKLDDNIAPVRIAPAGIQVGSTRLSEAWFSKVWPVSASVFMGGGGQTPALRQRSPNVVSWGLDPDNITFWIYYSEPPTGAIDPVITTGVCSNSTVGEHRWFAIPLYPSGEFKMGFRVADYSNTLRDLRNIGAFSVDLLLQYVNTAWWIP